MCSKYANHSRLNSQHDGRRGVGAGAGYLNNHLMSTRIFTLMLDKKTFWGNVAAPEGGISGKGYKPPPRTYHMKIWKLWGKWVRAYLNLVVFHTDGMFWILWEVGVEEINIQITHVYLNLAATLIKHGYSSSNNTQVQVFVVLWLLFFLFDSSLPRT